ncbi:MAG: 2,3-dihydro-2,3-dihydroxybenzoate dehydrogenase [Rhodospirillaceae bacterium]|nr:2,3-dihydro-2,3-dihydroxybenzoate dehydrogenase [Rhodospirillaceae bacterium]MAI49617.1 2,3-dihydro-2,3-dihydroxybenzoate dehydrogenase [Rhodospirillaceae bacterium]
MELQGIKNAGIIVTGAAQGIGEGVARHLASGGAKLALIDRQAETLTGIATELGAHWFAADVTDEASVETAISGAVTALGTINGLVNVAGVQHLGPLIDQSVSEFDAHFNVNLRGTWLVTRHVARHMTEIKAGSIVTVSSNAARVPRVRQGAYCASKAGVSHLMRVLALELGPVGIRVNTVAPGATETPMIQRMMESMGFGQAMLKGDLDNFRAGVPLGRIAKVEDVADAVAFLLSEQSRYITMHEMVVDGGGTLGA